MPQAQRTRVNGRAASGTAAPTDPMLATTFWPIPEPPDLVVRRRLLDLLDHGVERPLTLVSAPAGYGKSTLLWSWAANRPDLTVAHLTMEDDDAQQTVFWATATEACRRAGVDVSAVHLDLPADGVDRATLTRLARCITSQDEPLVWVVDCADTVFSEQVGRDLNWLLRRCADDLHLVVLTRTDPPLPLHRYRLEGGITEIRAADLAFTATEVSTFLQRAGLDVEPPDVAALRARTAGWPAGLRFAAMSLAGRLDTSQAIREFRGDTGNVASFLMSEVLAQQPVETRRFLLRSSIVDELRPGLVEAVTGQHCDERTLQFVAHGNAFVEPVSSHRGRYRYQSLFREFLRSQLAFEEPGGLADLHRAAAAWLVEQGHPIEAMRHAVRADDWDRATAYLVESLEIGAVLAGRKRHVLRELFGRLNADVEGVAPAVTRAALALARLEPERARAELARAEVTAATPGSLATRLALSLVGAVEASLGPELTDSLEAVLAAENGLRLLPPSELAAHPELPVLLAGCKGRVLLQRGDFRAAAEALEAGIEAARAPQLEATAAELRGMLSLVEAIRGQLLRAVEIVDQLRADVDHDEEPDAALPQAALVALAWVQTDQGDLDAAEQLITAAEGAPRCFDSIALEGMLALVRARLLRTRGEFDLTRAGLRAARTQLAETACRASWLDRALVREQVMAWLDEEQPAQALQLLQELPGCDDVECTLLRQRVLLISGVDPVRLPTPGAGALEAAPLSAQVKAWLLRAESLLRGGDRSRAEACVKRALRLAAEQGLQRPFAEATDGVRRLLESGGLDAYRRWLANRAASAPSGPAGQHDAEMRRARERREQRLSSAPVVNPLTAKEQEVLGYLADLLTTEEIASTMFVSVNTVRSHVRSILRKLGVSRRNEAVRRAWEMDLLPRHSA